MFYGLILALLHISVTFFICRLGDMSLAHVGGVFFAFTALSPIHKYILALLTNDNVTKIKI